MNIQSPFIWQVIRFGFVGFLSNGIGYMLYLALTSGGVPPKVTMTVLYLCAAGLSYLGNRRWTFAAQGGARATLLRYSVAHIIGYIINLIMLTVLVDRYGFPHQWIQALAVFVVASYLLIVFRYVVFTQSRATELPT